MMLISAQYSGQKPPTNSQLQKLIVESLIYSKNISSEKEIWNKNSQKGWISDSLEILKESQCLVVLGLKVYKNMLKCTICNKCFKHMTTMWTHFLESHKEIKASDSCISTTVQTLTEVPGFIHFFEVEVDSSKKNLSTNDVQSIPDTIIYELSNEFKKCISGRTIYNLSLCMCVIHLSGIERISG